MVVAGSNAAAFWLILGVVGSPTFFSFWNRSAGERLALTVLFVWVAARILFWYTRRLNRYATNRNHSTLRTIPLAFGLAVFGMTLAWLMAIAAAIPLVKLYAMVRQTGTLEWTDILLPLAYFAQFLFSQSTILWFLAAGISWPIAALHTTSRNIILGYYNEESAPRTINIGFVRVWNVFGYLIFLLSLLFQSD